MLGPEQYWDVWPTDKSYQMCMSEDKVRIKDSDRHVGVVYDSRGMLEVSTASPVVIGVLQMVSEPASVSQAYVG